MTGLLTATLQTSPSDMQQQVIFAQRWNAGPKQWWCLALSQGVIISSFHTSGTTIQPALRGMLTDPYTASWHICMHCVNTQATAACCGHLKRANKAASHRCTYSLHWHLPHARHDTFNRRLTPLIYASVHRWQLSEPCWINLFICICCEVRTL